MDINPVKDEYSIDFKEVVAHKKLFAITRLLATTLQINPYIHPGLFIRDLSDTDLQLLIAHADVDAPGFENLMLIALMLTAAEGIAATDAQIHRSINALTVVLSSESLFRKGLIKLHHKNFSFGEDAGNNIVLEKVEGVDYQSMIDRLDNGEDV